MLPTTTNKQVTEHLQSVSPDQTRAVIKTRKRENREKREKNRKTTF